MCYTIKCEACGEVIYIEEYDEHLNSCKPELEKVELDKEVMIHK